MKSRAGLLRSARVLIGAIVLVAGLAQPALAQREMELPALAPGVKARLSATYLSAEESKRLRIFHGQASAEDIARPADRAACALMWGAFADGSLDDASVPALDRAEARLYRGQPKDALELLKDETSVRAARVRVQASIMQGDAAGAVAAGASWADQLAASKLESASDIVDAVAIAQALDRLRGPGHGPDHQAMIRALGKARRIDALDWRVPVLEAQLLMDKDNFPEAGKALEQALSLNPACAQALALLGQLSVNAFDVNSSEAIAAKLDELAAMPEDQPGADGVARGVSPFAAVVRARIALRTDDPERASSALAPALARLPLRRELLAMDAAISAARYEFDQAEQKLASIDALCPGMNKPADARYQVGRVLSDLRQYAKASEVLERAAKQEPFWSAPQTELGLVEVQAGRDDRALTALEGATKLDPYNVRAGNSLKLVRDVATFTRVESDHFVVRAKPGIDALLAREMLPALEENFAMVTGKASGGIDHVPAAKTIIDLMPDHAWFAVRIAGMPRIHTIAASTGPVIAMEAPREGKGHTGTYDWQRVVRHEYAHTVGLSRTGNRIPHWFTEAQAVYLEHAPRDFNTIQLLTRVMEADALFDFSKINIAFTRPEKPTDRSQAYAQGHWMYQFMVETFGEPAPLALMDLYAKGVREEAAFKQVLSVSRDEFFTRFRAFANQHLIAWGMKLPDGTPTLAELTRLASEAQAVAGSDGPKDKPEPAPADEPAPISDAQMTKWLESYPTHPDVLELTIRRKLEASNSAVRAELIPLLERYAMARPVDPLPHRLLAKHYLASDTPAKAIEHLEYLDVREDHAATYAAELARQYFAAGDLDRASVKAERATRVAPYVASYRELAAAIAIKRSEIATARRHIEFLIALEPDREIHRKRLEALGKLKPAPAK
jgi:tetratricopeptide (TPR) repeat protein